MWFRRLKGRALSLAEVTFAVVPWLSPENHQSWRSDPARPSTYSVTVFFYSDPRFGSNFLIPWKLVKNFMASWMPSLTFLGLWSSEPFNDFSSIQFPVLFSLKCLQSFLLWRLNIYWYTASNSWKWQTRYFKNNTHTRVISRPENLSYTWTMACRWDQIYRKTKLKEAIILKTCMRRLQWRWQLRRGGRSEFRFTGHREWDNTWDNHQGDW